MGRASTAGVGRATAPRTVAPRASRRRRVCTHTWTGVLGLVLEDGDALGALELAAELVGLLDRVGRVEVVLIAAELGLEDHHRVFVAADDGADLALERPDV